jgi:16S rRNA processing protein RimM
MAKPLPAKEHTLEIGRVLRPHGLRGEVRVQLHWERSQALFETKSVWLVLPRGQQQFTVEAARKATKGVLLKLAGIDDRDAADTLRDATVLAERLALPPLEPDEYYLSDLVGATVLAPDGRVGIVDGVEVHPTVDSLVIRTDGGERLQQPLLEPFVERIDVDAGEVVLRSRAGLI